MLTGQLYRALAMRAASAMSDASLLQVLDAIKATVDF